MWERMHRTYKRSDYFKFTTVDCYFVFKRGLAKNEYLNSSDPLTSAPQQQGPQHYTTEPRKMFFFTTVIKLLSVIKIKEVI